jgi:protein dithiol oxidoreductase (disulfide-forming)
MRKLIAWAAWVLPVLSFPAAAEFLEGVEYQRLTNAQPVETGQKIEVREFFWYGCPHCYVLEPHLEKWHKTMPKNAAFVRTPGALNPHWMTHARTYYAFEALGLTDKLHRKLFDALHLQKQHLDDPQLIADFVRDNGGDRKAFLEAYNSFGVQTSVSRAQRLAQAIQLQSVPTLIVDGKYTTNANIAGGYDKVPAVLNHLVKLAAAERARK